MTRLSEETLNQYQKEAMELTSKWINADYGKRCKVYSSGCPSCEMWLKFDLLFADIEAEYEWMKKIDELAKENDKGV